MSSSETPPEPPLAGDGGVHGSVSSPQDPYRTLDDLMALVEAHCPTWPQRGTFVGGEETLL